MKFEKMANFKRLGFRIVLDEPVEVVTESSVLTQLS